MEVEAAQAAPEAPKDNSGASELDAEAFFADVSNAVHTYVFDGLDAMERAILKLENLEAAQPGSTQIIQQGLVQLHDQLQHDVEQALQGFKQLAKASIFYVPPAPAKAPEGAAAAEINTSLTAQDEQELDQQLQQLREQIKQVHRDNQQLRSSINHLEHDIMTAGSNPEFDSLAAALGSHQETMQGDLQAIAAATDQLQPLLLKAMQLRACSKACGKDQDVAERELRIRQLSAKSGLSSDAIDQLSDCLNAP